MKVVAAMDSFKGSLSSMQAGYAAREGILRAHPDAQVTVRPLADGGEGTTDALIEGLGGERITARVTGPLGERVSAPYGLLKKNGMAVMEMAAASGITLVKEKDPLCATTRGVGEMILDAAGRGARSFLIGIGGSATNDGGIGMLKALGWQFLTGDGLEAGEGAGALSRIAAILPPDRARLGLLSGCSFRIACDVTNPLCGPQGATFVYGPQKGLLQEQLSPIDRAMSHYADVTASFFGQDNRGCPGAGAAGGLGFALVSFLHAELSPGVQLVLDAIKLEDDLKDADILVTGEGRLDGQTVMGKAPIGAARLARKHGLTVIAVAGSAAPEARACNAAGIDAFFPILREVCPLEEAMRPETAYANLAATAEQIFRLL